MNTSSWPKTFNETVTGAYSITQIKILQTRLVHIAAINATGSGKLGTNTLVVPGLQKLRGTPPQSLWYSCAYAWLNMLQLASLIVGGNVADILLSP